MAMRKTFTIIMLTALCCLQHPAGAVIPARKPVMCDPSPLESGVASVYANMLDGGRTASGETFRQSAFTAAHLNLPFNSMIEVRDKKTGKSVMVRVNDRGPHVKGRILDLSSAARNALGHGRSGLFRVTLHRCYGG